MPLTSDQLAARRRVIVKRQAARKIRATWDRKRAAGAGGRRRKQLDDGPIDDYAGIPESDAVLDELPESLVG